MIKIENVEVNGWRAAIRGMRNPMNSWDKSDTVYLPTIHANAPDEAYPNAAFGGTHPLVGENDTDLMMRLRNAGTDHRKFMRMLTVYLDITAPLYWWKEFDTYKVGTVANSCSTMHKIAAKGFTLEDFSHEHLVPDGIEILKDLIENLNSVRSIYNDFDKLKEQGAVCDEVETRKDAWWQMIQLLPSSYNQKRTVMLNYEVLSNMYRGRKSHKLDEWREFCEWIEALPMSDLITGKEK